MEEKNLKSEKIISKYDYNFIIEHRKNKFLDNIELILENYSNKKIIITLYQFNDESKIKYSNIFSVDYFINQSPIIKCLLQMSKNDNYIEEILNIIKTRLNNDIKNNSKNLIYNEKNICFKIKSEDNITNINLIMYITLINLQKEKIKLNLIKKNYFSFSDNNINIPDSIYEILDQNNNMIQDISNMEKELNNSLIQKNEVKNILKKCNEYYDQNINMKMDFMDEGIDSEILKSKEEFIFIKNNITKRVNKKIKNFKQIYKASSNGDNINAFQENFLFCPNILILILTDEKKRFGGFTQSEFELNKYKYDPVAFLFSLDNKEIYPILSKYEKMAINCYEDDYPMIFGSDIYLGEYFFSNDKNITQEGFYDYKNSKIKSDYKLNGKKFFCVAELEIYQFDFFE